MAEGQNKQNSGQAPAQAATSTAKTAVNAVKAAGKAAAGDVAGAVIDLLKDENIRNATIAVILGFTFILTFLCMAVGSAITGSIEWLADNWSQNWDAAWEEQGIASNGNILYLYSTGIENALDQTIINTFLDLFETGSHEVDGQSADNSNIEGGGTNINESDYQKTIDSIKDQEALAGQDGALRKRLELIKNRLSQRGIQILTWASAQYTLDSIGIVIASSLSHAFNHPYLYHGVDLENSSVNIDISAFQITDIQALKILAAYCVQHECDLASADMWELMDYCGWYGFGITNEAFDTPANSIYDINTEASYGEEIAGAVFAGDEVDPQIYELPDPYIPYWTGTFAPQWYYEEVKQIKNYREDYDYAASSGDTETLATMYSIPTNSDGSIDYSSFRKLSDFTPYGIIDKLFTATNATLTISRTDYHGADEYLAEALSYLSDLFVQEISDYDNWSEMVGALLAQWVDTEAEVDTSSDIPSKYNGRYSSTYLHFANTEYSYCSAQIMLTDVGSYILKNYETGEMTDTFTQSEERGSDYTYQPQDGVYFDYLEENCYYQVYYCSCLDYSTESHEHSRHCGCYEHEHQYECIDTFDTYFSADSISERQAYQLQLRIDITFASRSVDELTLEIMGLWPGDLQDTITSSNGTSYAYGQVGNPNLIADWTDSFVDSTGVTRTMNFSRMYGYQYESYREYILGVADLLSLDTTGLFAPNNGYGDTIVTVAQRELEYFTVNNMYGGDRYWSIIQSLSGTTISETQRNGVWSTAFVLSCAYQCGYIGAGGCFGDYGSQNLPLWCGGLWEKLVSNAGASLYTNPSYTPSPGDLVFFAEQTGSANPDHVGIVSSVLEDGSIVVIEGDYNGKVVSKTYENYQISSSYQKYADSKSFVISSYIKPDYPDSNVENPLYLSITGSSSIITSDFSASYIRIHGENTILIAGYPRFRLSQLPEVVSALRTQYPEYYSEELLAAVNSRDTDAIISEWYDLFLTDNSSAVKQAQLTIAAQLFVRPVITRQIKENGFNWAATDIREEILLMLVSTTANEYSLNLTLAILTEGMDNSVSDEELLYTFMTDDYLCSILEENRGLLWQNDPEALQQEWISMTRTLLNELRRIYITSIF